MSSEDYSEASSSIRVPPHSAEAEQSVLGALLLDEKAWDDVSERVLDADFYIQSHRLIFRVIADLIEQEQQIDVVTVAAELEKRDQLEQAGNRAYLNSLVNTTPSIDNSAAYANIIKERAQLRRLINAASEMIQTAYEPEGNDSINLLADAEKNIAEIAAGNRKDSGPVHAAPLLKEVVHGLRLATDEDGSLTGLTTGFSLIDERTFGLQKADLIIVAARPSMGKTTYAMNLVENVLLATQQPCLVFSMEMPATAIVQRMVASQCRLDQNKMRGGGLSRDEWQAIIAMMNKFKTLPLYIDDTPALTPQDLRARARQVYRECDGKLGLIMIDYLQLMRVSGKSEGRTHEISEISRSLKALAKEFNCPVVALSQLNRSLEQRPNKRPVMSDLRESGAIEQDADIIQFIYRDEVYNEDSNAKGTAEIITGKHRNGAIGMDRLSFIGKYTRFENLAVGSYDQDDDDE